jgi:hypothetical protein
MIEPIPVICDLCRAAGEAGEQPFADLAGLLSFTPVPRRAHANGWTPEHQRAFIAALAATGSPARAARALGRHAFGAEQLRRARGGAGFSAAWDAALELARERELAGLRSGLAELAAEREEEDGRRRSAILPRHQRDAASHVGTPRLPARYSDDDDDEDTEDADARDYDEAVLRIRRRLTNARRLLLMAICDEPAKRAAWEVLVGPADWDKAGRGEAQDDEPFCDPEYPGRGMPRMAKPDMLLTAEVGLLADVAGGYDAMVEIREGVDKLLAEEKRIAASKTEDGERSTDE